MNQEKTTTLEKGSRQKAEPVYGQLYTWEQGMYPLIETPFQPQMDEHAELLKKTRFDTQLASIVMYLQRTYGNMYIQRLLNSMATQAKLTVSQRDDVYEQEVDRVSDMVIKNLMPQRQEEEEEGEEGVQTKLILQRQEGAIPDDTEARINIERGGGQPLSEDVRAPMEQAFGADFGGVRIHTDSEAHQLNESLQSRAFTTGQDIFFKNGEYSPGSSSGRKLLANELTHVVQQQAMPTLQQQAPETPAAEAAQPSATPDPTLLSGAHWRAKATAMGFTNSTSTDDLAEPFKTNVLNFIKAMEDAGANVNISTTKRSIGRAWLMHHAWVVAHGGAAPTTDPYNTGIIWDHGNPRKTRKAARQMIGKKGFNLAHDASMTSRHLTGNAIDMTITNMPNRWTFRKGERNVTVRLRSPNTGQNRRLWRAAKIHFNVIKLRSDRPHWSVDGH